MSFSASKFNYLPRWILKWSHFWQILTDLITFDCHLSGQTFYFHKGSFNFIYFSTASKYSKIDLLNGIEKVWHSLKTIVSSTSRLKTIVSRPLMPQHILNRNSGGTSTVCPWFITVSADTWRCIPNTLKWIASLSTVILTDPLRIKTAYETILNKVENFISILQIGVTTSCLKSNVPQDTN